jgi:hypothetical protein
VTIGAIEGVREDPSPRSRGEGRGGEGRTAEESFVAAEPVEDEAIHPRVFRQFDADTPRVAHFFVPGKSPKAVCMKRLHEENIIEISSRSYPRTCSWSRH